MNKRQGGEDFYFIQKVAQRGNWSECNATRVVASPRPSNRVPFGTGPIVEKYIQEQAVVHHSFTTYHPEPFRFLGSFFEGIDGFYTESTTGSFLQTRQAVLKDFLETQDFVAALKEIRGNSASLPAFRKRFWRWFNMFRVMKFLHYARDHGYPEMEVGEAAFDLLNTIRSKEISIQSNIATSKYLLETFRDIDRNQLFNPPQSPQTHLRSSSS